MTETNKCQDCGAQDAELWYVQDCKTYRCKSCDTKHVRKQEIKDLAIELYIKMANDTVCDAAEKNVPMIAILLAEQFFSTWDAKNRL